MWSMRHDFRLGDHVRAQDELGSWRSGRLVARRADGSFDVRCQDGSNIVAVPIQQIRPQQSDYSAFDGNATLPDAWKGAPAAPPPLPPDENRSAQYVADALSCEPGGGSSHHGADDGDENGEPAREREVVRPRAPPKPLVARPPGAFRDGARVHADYAGLGYYHPATVSGINVDGTYTLTYDDGLVEERVPPSRMGGPGQGVGAAVPAASDDSDRPPPPKKPLPPPARRPPSREPTAAEGLRVGSRAQGNWNRLGYWHPCTVIALLPDGAFRIEYEDGYEEEAPSECVLPVGASPPGGGGGGGGGGGFGRAAEQRVDSHRSGASEHSQSSLQRRRASEGPPPSAPSGEGGSERNGTPLAPRRRSSVGVREGEKVRKQVEEERKSRLETIKLRPEDKRWAEQNRKSGDSGLFQGMIVRFRSSLPAVAPPPPPPSESRIAVFVRARPLLEHELKAGGFGVVTAGSSEVSSSLVMHEPKTMVDLSKAMDNHTYRFDAVFGELATNEQIFVQALRPMVRALFGTRNGHGTCFAYGQTGSGKTVTMEGLGERARHPGNAAGLYRLVAEEIFRCVAEAAGHGQTLIVRAGFFEIYRGKCYDLLAKKRKFEVIEGEQSSDCL
jgi:hypothetical protein